MRMSCNGCRVLRKGCSDNCSIRPCLQWIKTPDSQANATVFLAKFYGRAGLMNLINAGPQHLRPAIFRSLLYEACGRIVNPIYGSVGLLWSGQWHLCQNAVESVLKGAAITPIATDSAAAVPPPPASYDIRHVIKDHDEASNSNSAELTHRVTKPTRTTRFKRPSSSSKPKVAMIAVGELTRHDSPELNGSSTSHDSTVSHQADEASIESNETNEADVEGRDGEVELELTLGFGFGFDQARKGSTSEPKSCHGSQGGDCKMVLGLV